jgi:hypothetical protein
MAHNHGYEYQQFRDLVFLVKHALHQQLLDPEETTIHDHNSGCHTLRLTRKTSLAQKLTRVQCGDDCFFALVGIISALNLLSAK